MADQGSLEFGPKHDELAAAQALASAERLDRANDPSAEGAFVEVESLAVKCADQELQMRAFESSGRFHERRGSIQTATKKYGIALTNAECLIVVSDAAVDHRARLRWALVRIANRDDPAFKNLVRASKLTDSHDRLRTAWDQFATERANSSGRLAARGFGSVEDFRRRIDAAEIDPEDDE